MCVCAFFSCFRFLCHGNIFISLIPVESVLRSWLGDFSASFPLCLNQSYNRIDK